jgi:hypothetical protein
MASYSKSKECLLNTQAFLYKWTHLPSGKWYVGSRTAKGCHPEDGYYCSSKEVKPLILANPQDVSPNNEVFDSSRKAGSQYNVSRNTIVSWAKNNKNGWSFIPKGTEL